MTSALHVGAGGQSRDVDMGVLRHADGRPFIPGSSMKGVLRSHLERLLQAPTLRALSLTSCLLHQQGETSDCPTPGWINSRCDATRATEADFERLCHVCTLFGSPILAGKVRIPDLEVDPNTFTGQVERRHGVGIDRDSGLAATGVLYDFEVIPSGAVFHFSLAADSPDEAERGLIAIAIRELMEGRLSVGGKTTRGLGACVLEDVRVEESRFDRDDDLAGLKSYLLGEVEAVSADTFLAESINQLF